MATDVLERPLARPRAVAAPAPLRDAAVPVVATRRDVALDLVRGLAIVVLLVNHVGGESWLRYATEPFLSAAEALVCVSGVVVGMVFGRRWLADGARATTRALLRRSFVLYRASVCVVALVGLATLVPGLATEVLTIAPRTSGPDLYAFDGPVRTAVAIVTLEAGPWQFNILGFFIASLATAPAVLWLLARGWWPVAVAASWGLFLLGRATLVEVLPAQSEQPFPFLIWQLLFVHAVVLGWHRDRVARLLARAPRAIAGAVLALATVAAYTRLHEIGADPLGVEGLLGIDAADWRRWDAEHFDKRTLDAGRLVTMLAFTAAAYVVFRRFETTARRTVGRVLLPLGRSSFYVFIVHVFVCLAVASVPFLVASGAGRTLNTVVQVACVGLLWLLVTRRVLFRWIPR